MSSEKCKLLHQLRSLLTYHKSSGLDEYPQGDNLDGFLRAEYLPKNKETKIAAQEISVTVPEVLPAQNSAQCSGNIEEIADEVKRCRSCSLCEGRVAPVPGVGGNKISLLFVGGWLTASSADEIGTSTVFGYGEDEMLQRMLNAIHFPRDATFITNVIKCGITASVQPKRENVDACVSYLNRQISATLPDVICTMGLIATRALLQNSKPLSQLRGRFYDYEVDGQKSIAVMPTYHPTFLLKNPEMKMATWNDLQLIEKRLKR